ncbi:MAG: hypothetical protein EKK48_10480 [Candidatus Melainabacteria bacterium]|nr:MAG: hypothetical protein EKK48_10480 [Candidatus Melainabacteria bacterium]
MDFKDLTSHFARTAWEPDSADAAWKRLYGDRPLDLDHLPFKERLETASAWRQETIKLARENTNEFQSLSKGEQDMQNTVSNFNPSQTSGSAHLHKPDEEQSRVDEQTRLDEQTRQEDQARADQSRLDAQTRVNEQIRLEEQSRAEQSRLEEQTRLDEQNRLDDQIRQEEQSRTEQSGLDEQTRLDEQIRQEEQSREEQLRLDEEAYKAAEEKFKELEALERQRQDEGRMGTNSAGSLLSKFFELIERVKQEREREQEQDREPEREQKSEQEQKPEQEQNHETPEPILDSPSVSDFYRQNIDDLLNSFDKSLDVEKDIDLNIQGPMLIDELDHYFDLDKDVDEHWNLDVWAEKQFSLDDAPQEPGNNINTHSSSLDNINNVLFGAEVPPQGINWEKDFGDLNIDSWERNAYDPELLREQSELSAFAVRENNSPEYDYDSRTLQTENERVSLDQILQREVQQIMQTQIQQTFTAGAQRNFFQQETSRPDKDQHQQEQNRDDDSLNHSR